MKIIKNGKRNYGEFKFKCNKCGCKFEADVSDYVYVEFNNSPPPNYGYHPTENNTPSDEIECNCPNCNTKVYKEIYKSSAYEDNNKGLKVFNFVGVILGFLTLIYVATHNKSEDVSSILLVISTVIYNFLHTIHIYDEY